MIDPVAQLDRYLARLLTQREQLLAEASKASHPKVGEHMPTLLEQIDRMKAQLENVRPQAEALRARLLEREQAAAAAPPARKAPPPDAPLAVPTDWPLSDDRIQGMIRDLVQRARPPVPAHVEKSPASSSDVKDISSSTWRAEAFPSPSAANDVRDIDSRFWKLAEEEARSDDDEWPTEGR